MNIDPRDRVAAQCNPCLPVPRHSVLPALDVGLHRYLLAADGLYLEARSRALRVLVRLAEAKLPFGELKAGLTIGDNQQVPSTMLDEIFRLARAALPKEWAAVVVLEKRAFRLVVPETLSASKYEISYSSAGFDPLDVVLDVHSHNSMGAYFSVQDDADDRANPTPVFGAMVVGRLHLTKAEIAARVVVHGRFYDMNLQAMPLSQQDEPTEGDDE